MAREVLDHGVIIPAEFSDDWYEDMSTNLNKLDEVIGSDAEKLSENDVSRVAISGDYNDLTNKPDLKPVATSGDYDDLTNKPDLKPVATSGDYDDLTNKPDLKPVATSGDYDDLTNKPDLKPVATSGDYDDLTNKPDLKAVATSGDYDDLTNKPSYGVLRMTSETLSNSGSGAISNLNSDSKLAAGDYVLDAALKVFPITAVSAPNYTVGSALFQVTNASSLAAVATSGSYDDLNNLPAYGITRFVNAAITDNSNVAFANISSVDKIKAGDFLLDNAGKMYLIASINSVNETAAVATPLTVLALNANVMHLSGNETSAGQKTFSDLTTFNSNLYFTNSSVTKGTIPQTSVTPYRIYFGSGVNYGASLFNIDTSVSNTGVQTLTLRSAENVVGGDDTRMMLVYDPNRARPRYLAVKGGIEPNANNTYDCGSGTNIWKDLYSYHGYFMGQNQNDEYSSNTRTNLTLLSNRDTLGVSGVLFDTYRQNTAQGTGIHILGLSIKENSVRYEGCRWGWHWDNNLNGYTFDFKPTIQGANQAVKHNLGTSTDKWDTVNGINPGSLSFPKLSSGLDISSYITVNGGNKESLYTPLSDGWISVALTRSGGANMAVMLKQGNFASSGHNIQQENGTTTCNAMLPVVGGVQVSINSALADGIYFAYFYPCQGNV